MPGRDEPMVVSATKPSEPARRMMPCPSSRASSADNARASRGQPDGGGRHSGAEYRRSVTAIPPPTGLRLLPPSAFRSFRHLQQSLEVLAITREPVVPEYPRPPQRLS